MKESSFCRKRENARVECTLCEHRCVIKEGKRGICNVRQNIGGRLYSLNYGKVVSSSSDPIEKKPLYHFQPGSRSYSIACQGCNFKCLNCQNWQISQQFDEMVDEVRDFGDIVSSARNAHCRSISYTYTEPTIFAETALETAVLAKQAGLRNVFVSNGYQSLELIDEMEGLIDGANIDLKSFSPTFYKKVCGGVKLEMVLRNIALMVEKGIWVEVTTLVIPGRNDSEGEFREIARFIRSVGDFIPWHVSAFYPTYRMLDAPRTGLESLVLAREVGLEEGLKYVYQGNIPGGGGEDTSCGSCGKLLIERRGFRITENNLLEGKCPSCSTPLDGVDV